MLIPDGFAQANFFFSGPNCPTGAQCTLGLDVTSGEPSPSSVAELVVTAFEANILKALNVSVTFDQVLVKFGPTDIGPSAVALSGMAGTLTGVPGVPNAAYLIHKITNMGGRAGRGRMYLPGLSEGEVDQDGTLAGTGEDVISGWFDDFGDQLALGNLTPVLLHNEGSPITTPTPIVQFICDGTVATQRRRLRR